MAYEAHHFYLDGVVNNSEPSLLLLLPTAHEIEFVVP